MPKLDESTEKCPKPKPKPKPKKKKPKKKPQSTPGGSQQQQQQQYTMDSWKTAQPGGGSPFLMHLDSKNFQEYIVDNDVPAIIEFYAPW